MLFRIKSRLTVTRLAVLAVVLLGDLLTSAQAAVPAEYFGMHYVKSQLWPAVPIGSLRLWDTDTRWQQMNPANGVYDFGTLDSYLGLAHSHGVSDVVLVLGGTPNWISSDPSNTVCDYASVAPGSCAPPADLNIDGGGTNQAWRTFIYQLASHVIALDKNGFSPIETYELWNEFSRTAESWTGSQEQMVRLAQDAYCILKGVGTITATNEHCSAQTFHVPAVGLAPDVRVASPSAQASGPDVDSLGAYFSSLGTFGQDGRVATNIVATHNYTYGLDCCAGAEGLAAQWTALRWVLPSSALSLPVWSTEGSWGDTSTKEPDRDMQSAYVARAYLLGWSLGFKRMYWYAWGNSWGRLWSQSGVNGCSDKGSGTGCLSPAAKAYAEMYSWMVGNTLTKPCAITGPVYSCQFTRPDATKTLVVWDSSMACSGGFCARSPYIFPAGYSSYLDLANVRHSLRGRSMWIGAKPVLLMSSTHASAELSQHSIGTRQRAAISASASQPLSKRPESRSRLRQ